MPNWCNNTLKVTHSDPAALEKFRDAWNSGAVFQTLLPCPQELIDTMAGSYGESQDKSKQYEKELHAVRENLNVKYFGYKNWYDYCVAEWGTKWDVGYNPDVDNTATIEEDEDGNKFVHVDFDSAWSPPTDAYDKLVDLGYGINAYYYEPGVGFCGRYDEEGDQTFEIRNNSKWVKRNIPADIEEAFNIINDLREMEEA